MLDLLKIWETSDYANIQIYISTLNFKSSILNVNIYSSSLLSTEKSPIDPNSSEHIIAINRLQDQLEGMKKQLQAKDQQLMEKDKKVIAVKTEKKF